MVFYGLFHGLFYLTVILSLIGPSPYESSRGHSEQTGLPPQPDHADSNGNYNTANTITGRSTIDAGKQGMNSLPAVEGNVKSHTPGFKNADSG